MFSIFPNSYVHNHENYGFLSQKGMGYGVLQVYGFWVRNYCPPTRWTENCMGFRRLWVITGMGYDRFDCTTVTDIPSTSAILIAAHSRPNAY